jgi:antitoxin (DNA-binding transcriptional repressor) of toxin-antitoxin stability system
MRTVDVGLFEHLCEELIDEVTRSGEPIVITRGGEPIAELAPFSPQRPLFWGAHHPHQVGILDNIGEPIDVAWPAER